MMNWRVSAAVLVGVLVCVAGWPSAVDAQQITLYSCADVQFEIYSEYDSAARPVLCRSEFSATDPYVVLYVQVAPIKRDTNIAIELLDPEGMTVFSRAGVLESAPSGYPVSYTFSYVLPLAMGAVDVLRKLPLAVPILLRRPARERLGEWTWKLWLDPGPSATLKFTLK